MSLFGGPVQVDAGETVAEDTAQIAGDFWGGVEWSWPENLTNSIPTADVAGENSAVSADASNSVLPRHDGSPSTNWVNVKGKGRVPSTSRPRSQALKSYQRPTIASAAKARTFATHDKHRKASKRMNDSKGRRPLRIHDLPREVIQQIQDFAPAHAAVALGLTCKKLLAATRADAFKLIGPLFEEDRERLMLLSLLERDSFMQTKQTGKSGRVLSLCLPCLKLHSFELSDTEAWLAGPLPQEGQPGRDHRAAYTPNVWSTAPANVRPAERFENPAIHVPRSIGKTPEELLKGAVIGGDGSDWDRHVEMDVFPRFKVRCEDIVSLQRRYRYFGLQGVQNELERWTASINKRAWEHGPGEVVEIRAGIENKRRFTWSDRPVTTKSLVIKTTSTLSLNLPKTYMKDHVAYHSGNLSTSFKGCCLHDSILL